MALSGIFLMLFLVIHLIGNLQLLNNDQGESFNLYAQFMTHNPLIKIVSYVLYASILLHAVQGILIYRQNRVARGKHRYAVNHVRASERASRGMAWLGIVIFVFIVIHMYQFWVQMHWGDLEKVPYEGAHEPVNNLYALVAHTYEDLGFVIFYVVSMVVVGFHLWHGFWSSFQTLGLNHRRYTPFIKTVGMVYAVGVPFLFAVIPVWMYLVKHL